MSKRKRPPCLPDLTTKAASPCSGWSWRPSQPIQFSYQRQTRHSKPRPKCRNKFVKTAHYFSFGALGLFDPYLVCVCVMCLFERDPLISKLENRQPILLFSSPSSGYAGFQSGVRQKQSQQVPKMQRNDRERFAAAGHYVCSPPSPPHSLLRRVSFFFQGS